MAWPKLRFLGAENRKTQSPALPFPANASLPGYMTAEISCLGKLYPWSFEEDVGSQKPTQHREREKQLPAEAADKRDQGSKGAEDA